MRVIILGAGRVGASVAESLASEENDITVVDRNHEALLSLQERFDLRTLEGNGTHLSTLNKTQIDEVDLLIACTSHDETNLVACKIAKQVFNVPRCIARARSHEFLDHPELMDEKGFGVDYLICPERSVTNYLLSLIEFPDALQVLEFANGRLTLVAMRVERHSGMVGKPVEMLGQELPNIDTRVVAIYRNNKAIDPRGATIIEYGDELFFIADSNHIREVSETVHRESKAVRRVMIVGGGNIGYRLCQELKDDYDVKLIEYSRRRADYLAGHLGSSVLVLKGDGTDEDLLSDENIQDIDMFIALTDSDESNIMSCLLAKRMGARRVVPLISRKTYAELMEGGRIDIAISPVQATISELLRYVRRGDVVAVHTLRRGTAEIMEVVAHGDRKHSKVIGKKIEDVALPKGTVIGALVRDQQVLMAHHDTVIEPNDHVIILLTNRKLVSKVEKLFQPAAFFF